jgi:hypothetical protein
MIFMSFGNDCKSNENGNLDGEHRERCKKGVDDGVLL